MPATNAEVRYLFKILKGAGLDTEANKDTVVQHHNNTNSKELSNALVALQSVNILTQANFDIVAAHSTPGNLAQALETLQFLYLLTQANFDIVAAHSTPVDLAQALEILEFPYLLTQEYCAAVAAHRTPIALAKALAHLHVGLALNSFTFLFISSQPDPLENIDKFTKTYQKTKHTYLEIYSAASRAHANIDKELQQAYALLLDYTKGKRGLINSPRAFFESVAAKCKRGFSGHMNRHHIDAVAEILDRIRNNQITSLSELREPLRAIQQIPGFNQFGSLAKRIHYIYPAEGHAVVAKPENDDDVAAFKAATP